VIEVRLFLKRDTLKKWILRKSQSIWIEMDVILETKYTYARMKLKESQEYLKRNALKYLRQKGSYSWSEKRL